MASNEKEKTLPTPMQWGQIMGVAGGAVICALFDPMYLVYAGLARFAWCTLGGRMGRGLGGLIAFGLIALVAATARTPEPDSAPHATVETITDEAPSPPRFHSAVLSAASYEQLPR